jgi:hypothetical protein
MSGSSLVFRWVLGDADADAVAGARVSFFSSVAETTSGSFVSVTSGAPVDVRDSPSVSGLSSFNRQWYKNFFIRR